MINWQCCFCLVVEKRSEMLWNLDLIFLAQSPSFLFFLIFWVYESSMYAGCFIALWLVNVIHLRSIVIMIFAISVRGREERRGNALKNPGMENIDSCWGVVCIREWWHLTRVCILVMPTFDAMWMPMRTTNCSNTCSTQLNELKALLVPMILFGSLIAVHM